MSPSARRARIATVIAFAIACLWLAGHIAVVWTTTTLFHAARAEPPLLERAQAGALAGALLGPWYAAGWVALAALATALVAAGLQRSRPLATLAVTIAAAHAYGAWRVAEAHALRVAGQAGTPAFAEAHSASTRAYAIETLALAAAAVWLAARLARSDGDASAPAGHA